MANAPDTFPPQLTSADMSLLLSGLVSIYQHLEGLASKLSEVDAELDALGGQITSLDGKVGASTANVAGDSSVAMASYLAEVAAFRASLPNASTGSPQIHGGIDTIRLSDDSELGRIYCDDNATTIERFVIKAAAGFREADTLTYADIEADPTYDDDRLEDEHDLETGFTHSNQPASVFASDSYTITGVPSSGTGAPPSGVFRRYYKLKKVTTTETDCGELYREWFINPAGREVWVDHWVMYANYEPPDAPSGVKLKLIKQSTGIPASADAFFTAVHAFEAETSSTCSYCNLQLEWKEFGV